MKEFPFEALEKKIFEFMDEQQMCVIATCSGGLPRASAVEFFHDGYIIYVLTEGGVKITNLLENPAVSVAIHGQFTGWDSVRGIQISGMGMLGQEGSDVFEEAREAYLRRKGLESVDLPAGMYAIKVYPTQMEYVDTSLRAEGYASRHIIRCGQEESN